MRQNFETNGGGLEYIYLIAFGNDPMDTGNILIVNAINLRLKSKVFPTDWEPESQKMLKGSFCLFSLQAPVYYIR